LLRGRARSHSAVDDVSFSIAPGRTLGLVGETGCGKTTLARALMRLTPTATVTGEVAFDGENVLALGGRALRRLRRRMQIVFQDHAGSLNPRMTVQSILGEPLAVHNIVPRCRRPSHIGQLLERVGLPAACAARHPHELSGGQRQRVGIARALSCGPELLICDEPVSALDVCVQAQTLNLLKDLRDDMHLSILFIAHDLAVVAHMADDIAVMHHGQIVERTPRTALMSPCGQWHPYTRMLTEAAGDTATTRRCGAIDLPSNSGSRPSQPTGCVFHRRCPLTRRVAADLPASQQHIIVRNGQTIPVVGRCATQRPHLQPTPGDPNHCHACLLQQEAGQFLEYLS
jgi:ABC-type oligopeptide transport system ATPase subunit